MPEPSLTRFVRVPTELVEALALSGFNGGQCNVLWWVIRQTYGWNRPSVLFTWYRIAKDLGMDRPATYRAGQALAVAGVLIIHEKKISIQPDTGLWGGGKVPPRVVSRQLPVPALTVAPEQRPPLSEHNASVVAKQPKRCLPTTLFRRAKDIKDSSKKYIKTPARDDSRHGRGTTNTPERRHLAEAAKPIPRKYERLSQD